MKKLFFALVGVAMVASSAVAQNFEKNIFGVRAGLNVANMSMQGLSANSRAGFHVAGVYQRLLMDSQPLYFETGLQISQKGFKSEILGEKMSANPLYLEIPVMVNYKFNIKDVVTLYPSVGFYYALGVAGKSKYDFGGMTEKLDLYGKDGGLKRSDFGMRFSATAEWKQFVFSLGYEFGFINVSNESISMSVDEEEFAIAPLKMKTGNFFLSVGYNF